MGHTLDDQSFLTKNDSLGMADLTHAFPEQCHSAWRIARSADLSASIGTPVNHVVLTGLGGSAAGGDLIAALFADQGNVPFFVNRDYTVPEWVGMSSLVYAASYSGNTEETLAAYKQAKQKGARVIVCTSGGALLRLAEMAGDPVILVPGDQPPRTALGYMMLPLVYASQVLGLIPTQDFDLAHAALTQTVRKHQYSTPYKKNPAKKIAQDIFGKQISIYGSSHWTEALAYRWRSQINENSKLLASNHTFPELCHNEILGWQNSASQGGNWATLLLRSGDESDQMLRRIKFTFEQIGAKTELHEIEPSGETLLAKILCMAHIGDYISLYLAALGDVDPGEIRAIDALKKKLGS